jgi:hypothetical protein
MSQPDDRRELSGLARSIDSLFTRPTPGASAPESAGAPLEAVPLEAPEAPQAPEAPEAVDAPARAEAPAPAGEYDFGDWMREHAPPEAVAAAAEAPLDANQADTDIREHEVPAAEPDTGDHDVPVAEPAIGAGPHALQRAVDAFLAGSPGAAAEVAELAEGLRERLALDPVADAVERLVRAAGDPADPAVLDLALETINPAVASRIVQRIGHERDAERIAEYRVLCRRLGEIMARAFRGALTGATEREARRKYYDMLIAISDGCRPIIEGMVEDENTLLVRSGIAVLGEIGGERALELVTGGLAHPDKRVRAEALLSLAKLGDGGSAALVMASLDDPERDVRVAAATAAGELRIERALRPLLAQLEDARDGGDSIPFIDALGKLGDPGAVPAIEKHAVKTLFSKPPTEVRVAAYRALHRIGTPHARELVQKALEAKEPGVWVAVRQLVDAEPES